MKRGELSNWGALRNLPQEAPGRQAPPFFLINRRGGLFQNVPNPVGMHFCCFGWKMCFLWRKSKPRCFRNASETFPWAISWRFSVVLRSFFVLQPVSFRIRDFQFISCFVCFHLYFVHFRFYFLPFLTSLACCRFMWLCLSNGSLNFNYLRAS